MSWEMDTVRRAAPATLPGMRGGFGDVAQACKRWLERQGLRSDASMIEAARVRRRDAAMARRKGGAAC